MSKTKPAKKKSKLGFIGVLSSFFSTFLTTVVSIVALVFMAAFLFNINMYNVKTGSMEPTYHINSIVFVKTVDFSELEVGDAITFVKDSQGNLVTHRIVSIDSAAQTVNTKGDANANCDVNPVVSGNIIGKVIFNFPIGGGFLEYVIAQENRAVVFGALAAFGVLSFILDKLEKKFSVESEEDESKKPTEKPADADTEKKVDELVDEMKLDAILSSPPTQLEVTKAAPPETAAEDEAAVTQETAAVSAEADAESAERLEANVEIADTPEDAAKPADLPEAQKAEFAANISETAAEDEAFADALVSALLTATAADSASGQETMSPNVKLRIERLIEKLETLTSSPKWGSLSHKLSDILFIGLVSTVCGGSGFENMEDTGLEKLDWFSKRLELSNGVPDSNTFRRVLESLDPARLDSLLQGTVDAVCGANVLMPCGEVSVWAADDQLMLGQPSADIPELLSLLDLSGCTVSVDAEGRQKAAVDAICKKNADYVISLKSDKSGLLDTVKHWFDAEKPALSYTKTEKAHGRIEKREYSLETKVTPLAERSGLTQLGGIGMVKSTVLGADGAETAQYCSYFITSLTELNRFSDAVRRHWSVESRLGWQLGISCTGRNNADANCKLLQQKAVDLLNAADFGKSMSLSRKKLCVAMNSDRLELVFPKKQS